MSKDALIAAVEEQHIKQSIPTFRVGDSLKVSVRVVDVGGKERVQHFTGTLVAHKGVGSAETITLHRYVYGSGMERVFFVHSPLVVGIEVVRTGKVRRSKLYYLRGTSGKATKVKERYVGGKGSKGPAVLVEEPVEETEVTPAE